MALHLFIEGPAWQLQLGQYGLDIALVPGQRGFQAVGFEGLLLRSQGLPSLDAFRFRFAKAQYLAFGDVGQFAHISGQSWLSRRPS